jgi:hypothetical protein
MIEKTLTRRDIHLRRLEIQVTLHALQEQYADLKSQVAGVEFQEAGYHRELAELALLEADFAPLAEN